MLEHRRVPNSSKALSAIKYLAYRLDSSGRGVLFLSPEVGLLSAHNVHIVFIFLFLALRFTSFARVSCIDDDGAEVDWFLGIKPPLIASTNDSEKNTGKALYLLDSRRPDGFRRAVNGMHKDGAIGRTLAPLLDETDGVVYAIFSDNYEGVPGADLGAHTKLVILADDEGAILLQHSLPDFPRVESDGGLAMSSQSRYGQHILCLSMTNPELDRVATMIRQIVGPRLRLIHGDIGRLLPKLSAIITKRQRRASSFMELSIHTRANETFRLFMKSSLWGQHQPPQKQFWEFLFSMLVPGGKGWVQSWLSGRGKAMCPYCPEPNDLLSAAVTNVKTLRLDEIEWSSSCDHSKWGISRAPSHKWSCLSDINRQCSQSRRGGLAICTQRADIHSALTKLVIDSDGECAGHDVAADVVSSELISQLAAMEISSESSKC